ncbi:TPA: class I SAM-dependent methyltransferase [Pseudomonas aeruginosa]|nr:class I SAM-dependent methyltransferase [Pseudomonas aeruginosa]
MEHSRFHAASLGAPAHPTLLQALSHWQDEPGLALDLGCGSGRDSLELLRNGWAVQAIDRDADALRLLRDQAPEAHRARLETRQAGFESLVLPTAQLVNASFALPFCAAPVFSRLWREIESTLAAGGLFAGHLFGERDQWRERGLTLHSREQAQALLGDCQVLQFEELEWQGRTALGRDKHWHLFAIVARRRD